MRLFNWPHNKPTKQVAGRTFAEILMAVLQDIKEQQCPAELIDNVTLMTTSGFSDQSLRKALAVNNSVARRQTQRLLVAFGKLPFSEVRYDGPPIADLTQEQVVDQVQYWVLFRDTAERHVQIGIVTASVLDANQVKVAYSSQAPITLQSLPLTWAVHCMYHGASPRIIK